jgi:O-antigen/teichoic acid export membrane protein
MSTAKPASNLTSGRVLARNTIWNLAGQLLPMLAGIVCLPPLVRGLGVARFGVLSLAWIVIGYFSLFDLGIGRALTKLVADKLGAGEQESVSPLVWTSLLLMLLMGVFAGLLTLAISPWLVEKALKIPPELQGETLRSFYLLGISVPMVTLTSGLRGILEAHQRFALANAIRVPMSIFSFAGPLVVLPFSHSLVPVIIVLVVGRMVGLVAHIFACFHSMPVLRHNFKINASEIQPLIAFGGWITVTNVLGPVVSYIDRFLIGALISVSAVAYYTTPLDVVSRLTVIPGALSGVLFPAFTVSLMQNPKHTSVLLSRAIKYILIIIFPIILVMVCLAPEFLRLWLGSIFAQNSSTVLRLLAAGVFVNCFSTVPSTFVQSAGRPDISAKLYLLELPLYVAMIWMLARHWGIEGTAAAWSIRITLDAVLLFYFSYKLLPHKPAFLPRLAGTVSLGLLLFYLATLLSSLAVKVVLLSISLVAFGLISWFRGLGPVERGFLLRRKTANIVEERS